MVVLRSRVPLNAASKQRAEAFKTLVIETVEQKGWDNPARVRRSGFVQMEYDESHWYNPEYLTDGVQFDPSRPEFLVIISGRTIGMMFVPENMRLTAPEPPAAPRMRWHYHRYSPGEVCSSSMRLQYRSSEDGTCRVGDALAKRSPLMAHVWIFGTNAPFAGMLPINSTVE